MPTPKPSESRQDFVNRCIPYLIREGKHPNTDKGRKAAAGECYGIYDNRKKSDVLKSIQNKLDEMEAELEDIKKEMNPLEPYSYNNGIYLKQNHTKYIYDGDKTLVLRMSEDDISNQRLLLFDKEFAYGYIFLEKPFKIENWEEFRDYKDRHQTTTEEWIENEWSFPLYAYGITSTDFFNKPKGMVTPTLKSDILNEADRYINDTGEIQIEERIAGDE